MVAKESIRGPELALSEVEGRTRHTFPRVRVETPGPPAFEREHWKGNDCRGVLCPVLTFQHAKSRFLDSVEWFASEPFPCARNDRVAEEPLSLRARS